MSDSTSDSNAPDDQPNGPGAPRVRGLPSPADLRQLVRTYLEHQHRCWPELVGTPALPEITEASVTALAEEYETAYRSGQHRLFNARCVQGKCTAIGAAYIRYSDRNSNTRSLDQQLGNILKLAAQYRMFVPWTYVFGDAAITGTTADRNGYSMLRQLVQSRDRSFESLFADHLDRLNRDEAESHSLKKSLDSHGKRLLTADGYDSSNPSAKIAHSFNAMQSEFYVDQLRRKVDRGMTDAFLQGKNVASLPLGYKLIPRLDAAGLPIIRRSGRCEMDVCIDGEAAEVVRRIFESYARSKKSPARIAQELDAEQALGRSTWGPSSVAAILKNEKYIGRVTWKKTRMVAHPRTGKKAAVPRPQAEHLVQEVPAMRIVSEDLWQAARRREREVSRDTGPVRGFRASRQSQYPTRLFRLYCQACDKPLRLYRSGKYPTLCCPSGSDGLRGCSLRNSKSQRIVEECILAHLRLRLLDTEVMKQLVAEANTFLAAEAARPPIDMAAVDEQIHSETAKIKRLARRLADLEDGPAADTLLAKTKEAEAALHELELERDLAAESNIRPELLDRDLVEGLLNDLRQLLDDEPGAGHPVLAKAVSDIPVTLGEKRGRSHAWIARLSPNPVPVLLEIAKRRNCPSTHSLEYLHVRSWTVDCNESVEIRFIPVEERLAEIAGKMAANGSSVNAIAHVLGVDGMTAEKAIELAKRGRTSPVPPRDLSFRRELPKSKIEKLMPEVVRLRDEKGWSFQRIAKQLGTSAALASRAYRQHHKTETVEAVLNGQRPPSASPQRRLSNELHDEIETLLREGKLSFREIARRVGVTPWTVRNDNKKLQAKRKDRGK